MRIKITKRAIDAAVPGGLLADTEVRGFVARRLPSGTVTYGFRYRNRAGKRLWLPLGLHGSITPDQARDLAKRCAGVVADGRDPQAEQETARAETTNTVGAVLDSYLDRVVRKQNLRTADEIEATYDRLVRPRLGSKPIYDLGRRDIVDLLDHVEDNNGPVMADKTLAHLRRAFNWQAARDDRFRSPIIRGMARTKPKARARDRVLTDEEIRDLDAALNALDAPARYPPFVRTLLRTAQRRSDVSHMTAAEIDDATWIIPAERYKTGIEHAIPLTKRLLELIDGRKGFIFSNDGKRPLTGYSKAKKALDMKIAELRKRDGRKPMARWTLHDLRRTARSLMSRAGVPADHAERVLGHAIPGVRGVYDRFAYLDEKRDALERLAALIERILHPAPEAVVPFQPRMRKPTRRAQS